MKKNHILALALSLFAIAWSLRYVALAEEIPGAGFGTAMLTTSVASTVIAILFVTWMFINQYVGSYPRATRWDNEREMAGMGTLVVGMSLGSLVSLGAGYHFCSMVMAEPRLLEVARSMLPIAWAYVAIVAIMLEGLYWHWRERVQRRRVSAREQDRYRHPQGDAWPGWPWDDDTTTTHRWATSTS